MAIQYGNPEQAFNNAFAQGTRVVGQQQENALSGIKLAAAQGDPGAQNALNRLDPERQGDHLRQQLLQMGIDERKQLVGGRLAKSILASPDPATAYTQLLPQLRQIDPDAPDDFASAAPHVQVAASLAEQLEPSSSMQYISNNGQIVGIDKRTGQAKAVFGSPTPEKPPAAPSGYQYTPQGGLSYIPGGPADPANKPLTESQSKAATYASRMSEADKIIRQYGTANTLAEQAKGETPIFGNMMVSNNYQQLKQAQEDWLTANLRNESGATIGETEFNRGRKQYFPQQGDSPETIAQKDRNRKVAEEQMANSAGRVFKEQRAAGSQIAAPAIAEGATATNPATGQKITFRGGKWQ